MTSCRLSPTVITTQAERLLDVSIRKVGTDEAAVIDISCTTQRAGCVAELDKTVYTLMTPDERAAFNNGVPGKTGRVISRIFQDELDSTDLSHAQDCLTLGRITHRDGRFDYFRDGVLDLVDFSSTSSKVGAGIMVGGIVALCFVSPPIAIAVGAALVVGSVAVSGIAVIKNGIEIAVGDDSSAKEDWRDLGNATTALAASALPLRPTIQLFKETWIPRVTPVFPFSPLARTSGTLPEFAQLPIAQPAASGAVQSDAFQLAALLGEFNASTPLATAASMYKSGNGGTHLFKIKINWAEHRTTLFIWDQADGLLFQVKDGHIVNSDPGMWPLIPNLVTRIMQRKPLAPVEGIRSVEVLELSEYAAHQMRPEITLPPTGADIN